MPLTLVLDGGPGGVGQGEIKMREEKQEKQKQTQEYAKTRVEEIISIQGETNKKVDDLQKLNDDTLNIANKTIQKMEEISERMGKIQRDLDDLGFGIKRGSKELNKVMANFFRDYVVLAIVIFIIIIVVIIIIVRIVMYALGKSGVSLSGNNSAPSSGSSSLNSGS